MPSFAILFDGAPISSSPRNVIDPFRWPTMPMMARIVVVLPAPFRPSNVTTSPSPTSNFMPCRMWDSPYQDSRSRTWRSVFADAGVGGSFMAGPHVGVDDGRVLGDDAVRSFRQHLAPRQHGDCVGDIGD